jgi:hypothetical protein
LIATLQRTQNHKTPMTTDELIELFSQISDECPKFTDIKNPRVNRSDLNAFLLLNELVPSEIHGLGYGHDMVSCAEHDEIWLHVTPEDLAPIITREQVVELVACGVHVDRDTESLHMFA